MSSDEQQLTIQFANVLQQLEEEIGEQRLKQLLADCLAATCVRTPGNNPYIFNVEKEFVSANISVSINY